MGAYNKLGLPPGSLHYDGPNYNEPIKFTLIEYNENDFFEKEFHSIEACCDAFSDDKIKWVNVEGVHNPDTIETIGKLFDIHKLTLEDVLNTDQRPKFEDYDNYLVCITKMLHPNDDANEAEQLTIILKENIVLTFQELDSGDAFDLIRERLRVGKGRIRKQKADYLAYCLLDAIVDCFFNVLEKIGDQIEALEESLVNKDSGNKLNELYRLKRDMIYIRKIIWPIRDMISSLECSESSLINDSTEFYLRDVHDHAIRIIDSVDTYRDLLAGLMDVYISKQSNRLNEVMKVLTVITTIFVPVTFIVGVYGMNFKNMPELNSPYGYWTTWIVMIVIMISLFIYFKTKKWI